MKIFDFFKDEPTNNIIPDFKYTCDAPLPIRPRIKQVVEIKSLVYNANELIHDGYVKSAISTYEIAAARLNEYITELKESLNETP